MDIKNAVVVVTGASSGIGEATARAASRAGARVVLLARRQDRIEALEQELGDALAVVCDITRPDQVQHAIDSALSKFGRIDVLINNAGQGLHASIRDIDIEDFKALLNLNSVAPLAMLQAVIPTMIKQGRGSVVNVSSRDLGHLPRFGSLYELEGCAQYALKRRAPGAGEIRYRRFSYASVHHHH